MKKNFFVCDFNEHFSVLTDEQAGKIIKAVFALNAAAQKPNENLTETYFEDRFLQTYWQLTKELVQKQTSLLDKRRTTSAKNGKKGGRPKKKQNNLNNLNNLKNQNNLNDAVHRLLVIEAEIQRRKNLKKQ